MKSIFILLSAFVVIGFSVLALDRGIQQSPPLVSSIAYAQESPLPTPEPTEEPTPPPDEVELPPTAGEGLQQLIAYIVAFGAIVGMQVTELLKKLPRLTDAQRDEISGAGAVVISAIVALVVALVSAYGGLAAGFLDDNGFWQVLLLLWPVMEGIFVGKKTALGAAKFFAQHAP